MNIWGFVTIIALDFVVASYAAQKGRSKGFWFLLSLLITPLLSWLVLFFLKPLPSDEKASGKSTWKHAAVAGLLVLVGGYAALQLPSNSDTTPRMADASSGAALTQTAPAIADSLTAQQHNAIRSAKQYLSMQGFSRNGLIHQLSSDAGEGYNAADATVAVDSLSVDWNQQATRSAKQYLEMQGFSCKGLVRQLSSSAGEGYTNDQAEYGARQAGAC